MNLDEAKRCYDIAKAACTKNDFDRAEKFLIKSVKLHETPEAQVLLQRLDFLRKQFANK